MPNDARESDRLGISWTAESLSYEVTDEINADSQHELMIYTLRDRLGLAPPCDPKAKVGRVLDVGTGTGIWAADFGELHPEADVSHPRGNYITVARLFSNSVSASQVLGMDLSAPAAEL